MEKYQKTDEKEPEVEKIEMTEEQKRERFFKIHIGLLELSPRAFSCLTRVGIDTVGKLIDVDVSTIKKIRNLGEKTLTEILEIRERLRVQLQSSKTDGYEEKTEMKEEQRREEFLNESIYTLGLSVLASNCLKRGGIDTIGKLIEADIETLKKIRNLGEKILNETLEIRERLIAQLQPQKTDEDEKEPEMTEEQKREEFFSKSIYTLGLSVLASNCLNRGGIDTIGKLLEADIETLKKIRNLGKKILNEVLDMQEKIRKQMESEKLDKEETEREQKEKELSRCMQEDSELDEAISKAERLEQIQEYGNKIVDE